MQAADFGEFDALLRQLADVFNRKITDDFARSYWGALKDLSLASVRRRADEHLRRGKFFPKPYELRPKDEPAEKPAGAEAAFRDVERRNSEMWRNWHARDPELAALEHGIALAARILARDHEGSAQYAEALREDRMLRDRRMQLLKSRAAT